MLHLPPSQNFTGTYHHITPSLLKEILMSTDLTWPSWPPVKISQVHSIMLYLPPAKISQVHSIMLHLPSLPKFHRCISSHYTFRAKGNFGDYRFDLTKLSPQLKFHRCIPSHYTFPAKGNFDVYRFDLTKLTPNQNFTGAFHHVIHTPPAKISQVHSITLHLSSLPKFHRCIPSCYTFPAKGNFGDYRFDLTKLTPPPAKISQMHTIMLHLPC